MYSKLSIVLVLVIANKIADDADLAGFFALFSTAMRILWLGFVECPASDRHNIIWCVPAGLIYNPPVTSSINRDATSFQAPTSENSRATATTTTTATAVVVASLVKRRRRLAMWCAGWLGELGSSSRSRPRRCHARPVDDFLCMRLVTLSDLPSDRQRPSDRGRGHRAMTWEKARHGCDTMRVITTARQHSAPNSHPSLQRVSMVGRQNTAKSSLSEAQRKRPYLYVCGLHQLICV